MYRFDILTSFVCIRLSVFGTTQTAQRRKQSNPDPNPIPHPKPNPKRFRRCAVCVAPLALRRIQIAREELSLETTPEQLDGTSSVPNPNMQLVWQQQRNGRRQWKLGATANKSKVVAERSRRREPTDVGDAEHIS